MREPVPAFSVEEEDDIFGDYDKANETVPAPVPSMQANSFQEAKVVPSASDDEVSLVQIQRDLVPSKEAAQSVADKKTVIFLGDTGVGKTTTINFLAGRKIISSKEQYGTVLIAQDSLPGFVIGHTVNSETRFVRATKISGGQFLCDAPGLDDTKGVNFDVPNAVGIANVIKVCKSAVLVVLLDARSIALKRGAIFSKSIKDIARFTKPVDPAAVCVFFTHAQKTTCGHIISEIRKIIDGNIFGSGTPENRFLRDLVASLDSKDGQALLLDPTVESNRKVYLDRIANTKQLNKAHFSFPLSSESLEKLTSGVKAVVLAVSHSLSQSNYRPVSDDLACLKSLQESIDVRPIKDGFEQSCTHVVSRVTQLTGHARSALEAVKVGEAKDEQMCEQLNKWLEHLANIELCSPYIPLSIAQGVFDSKEELRSDINAFVSGCAAKAANKDTPFEIVSGQVLIVKHMEQYLYSVLDVNTKDSCSLMTSQLAARVQDLNLRAQSQLSLLQESSIKTQILFDKAAARTLYDSLVALALAVRVPGVCGEQATKNMRSLCEDHTKLALQVSHMAFELVTQAQERTNLILSKQVLSSEVIFAHPHLRVLLCVLSNVETKYVLDNSIKGYAQLVENLQTQSKQLFSLLDKAIVEDDYSSIISSSKQLHCLGSCVANVDAMLDEKLLLLFKKLEISFQEAKSTHVRVREAPAASENDYLRLNTDTNKLLSAIDLDDFFPNSQGMTIRGMKAVLVQGFAEELKEVVASMLSTISSCEKKSTIEFEVKCNRLENLFSLKTHIDVSGVNAIGVRLTELWQALEDDATSISQRRPQEIRGLVEEVKWLGTIVHIIGSKPQLKLVLRDYLANKAQEVNDVVVDGCKKVIEYEKHKCLQEIKSQNFAAVSSTLNWFEEAYCLSVLIDLRDLLSAAFSALIVNIESAISDLISRVKLAIDKNSFSEGMQLLDQIQSAQVLQKRLPGLNIHNLVSELRALLTVKKNSLNERIVEYLSKKQYAKVAELLGPLKQSQSEADRAEYNKCDDDVYRIVQDKYYLCSSLAESEFSPFDPSTRSTIASFADCADDFVKLTCLSEVISFPVKESAATIVAAFKDVFDGLVRHFSSNLRKFKFSQAGRSLCLLTSFSKYDARFKECQFGAAITRVNEELDKLPEALKAAATIALGIVDVVVFHESKHDPKHDPKQPSKPSSGPQKHNHKASREEKKSSVMKGAPPPYDMSPSIVTQPSGLEKVAVGNIDAMKLDFLLDQCDAVIDNEVFNGLDFGSIRTALWGQMRNQFKELLSLGNQFVFVGALENAREVIRGLDFLMESKHLNISNCSGPLATLRDSYNAAAEDISSLHDPEAIACKLLDIKKSQGQHLFLTAVRKLEAIVERSYSLHFEHLNIENATASKLKEVHNCLTLWNSASSMMIKYKLTGLEFFHSHAEMGRDIVNPQTKKVIDEIKKAMRKDDVDYSSLCVLETVIKAFSCNTLETYDELVTINTKLANRLSAFQAANLRAQQYLTSLCLFRSTINAKELEPYLEAFSHVQPDDAPTFSPFNCLRDKIVDGPRFVDGYLKQEELKLVAQFARNLVILRNQQRLPDISECAALYHSRLIKTVREYVESCNEAALAQHKAKAFRDLETSWVRLENLQTELGVAIPEVFHANVSDELAKLFTKELQAIMTQFESDHPQPTLNDMKLLLLQLKLTVSEFSNSIVTTFLKKLINDKLNQCAASLDLFQLGVLLSAEGTEGMQIVSEYPQFQAIIIAAQQEASASVSVKDALDFLEQKNTIDRGVLEEAYSSFDRAFKSHLEKYILHPHQIGELVSITKSKVAAICSTKQNWHEICRDIPLLLAGIFGVWTITKSAKLASGTASNHIVIKPHPVQVLTLFRLLGLDTPDDGLVAKFLNLVGHLQSRMKSHIAEVVTGGGKSIILGILATTLALLNFHIHSACYSKYLCERDEADFEELWELFGVSDRITFSTLEDLANDIIAEGGDVRALVQQFLMGGGAPLPVKPFSAKIPKHRRILLIDEVDVFFSPDFYGATYNPSTVLPIGVEVQKYIWEHRAEKLSFTQLKELPCYLQTAKKFSAIMELIDCHFKAMLSDVNIFKLPAYVIQEDSFGVKRIGYKSQDTVSFGTLYGYKTAFAYLFESEQKNVLERTAEDQLGLLFACGRFSYAEIPNEFLCILGVSGTLSTGTDFEKEVIRLFGINHCTITPSIYGKSNRDDDVKGLKNVVEDSQQEWFQKIMNDAVFAAEERAAVIFFDTEEQLQEFCDSTYGERLLKSPLTTVVTEKTKTSQLDHAIAKATSVGAITLFPRVFGRGLDFKVFDRKVAQNGGVHIIQTFFSESASEEIQIKGRTARMKAKGSFQMILCSQILCKSDMTVNSTKLKSAIAKSPADVYAYLATCRDAFNAQRNTERKKCVANASAHHKDAMLLQGFLTSRPHNVSETLRLLRKLCRDV